MFVHIFTVTEFVRVIPHSEWSILDMQDAVVVEVSIFDYGNRNKAQRRDVNPIIGLF